MRSMLRNHGLKSLLTAISVGVITYIYYYLMFDISRLCTPLNENDKIAEYCPYVLNSYYLFYTLYALIALKTAVLVMWWRAHRARVFWVGIFTLLFAMRFHAMLLAEILDPRIYTFEPMIVLSYVFMLVLIGLTFLWWAFPAKSRLLTRIALITAVISIPLFAVTGRGSIEHAYMYVGGFPWQISIAAFSLSRLLWLVAVTLFCGFIYWLVRCVAVWIRDGDAAQMRTRTILPSVAMMLTAIVVSSLSYPLGLWFAARDVNDAKTFIADLIKEAKVYKERHGDYPKDIAPFATVMLHEKPRLLNRYEYLAMGYPGSYYFSRESKFCFVFQDPSKPYGYFSITSERDWKYIDEKATLEESYLSVCDDVRPDSGEGLIGAQLGLDNPEKLEKMFGKQFDQIEKEALTPNVADELEKRFHDLGKEDPSIYGTLPNDVEKLRRSIQNAPVEKPEEQH